MVLEAPMDEFLMFLLIIYVLSPIPLLVLFLVRHHAARKASGSLREMTKECENLRAENEKHLHIEEEYRQYVCQLQNQLRAKDPEARIGVLLPNEQADPAPVQQVNEPKGVSFPTPLPVPGSVSAQSPLPAPAHVKPLSPSGLSVTTIPSNNSLPEGSTPLPSSVNTRTAPQALPGPSSEHNHTPWILTTGVLLLLLASVGFISATWSMLTIGVRALFLLSFSAIFLGAGIFARVKLKLQNTSIAFYSIGSATLPITILGSAGFGLLGKYLTMEIPMIYNTFLLAFTSLLLLLLFGAVFFRSRVFAARTLACASFLIFTLALKIDTPYQIEVLLVELFASAAILLVPLVRKIPESSPFFCFAKVFEVYSIVNIYVMCVIALLLSDYCIWSGILLLLFAGVFLVTSVLSKKTGLMSLPSAVLIMVGTAQIFRPDNRLSEIIWLLTIGLCFLALSYVKPLRQVLRRVFFGLGLSAMLFSTFPIFEYITTSHGFRYIPMTLILSGTMVFLSIQKKRPILFAGALIPGFLLIWNTIVQILSMQSEKPVYISVTNTSFVLAGMVVSGVMYFLFSFIPHHRFFTTTGNILLFHIFFAFSLWLSNCLTSRNYNSFTTHFIIILAFVILCLIHAYRKDDLNYRNKNQTGTPRSITAMRCYYASVWPLIFCYACLIYIFSIDDDTYAYLLPLMILIGFIYMVIYVFRCGTAGILAIAHNYDDPEKGTRLQTPARNVAFFVSIGFSLIFMYFYCSIRYDHLADSLSGPTFVLQHLIPFLIPVILFLIAFRKERISRMTKTDSSSSVAIFRLRLLGLISASLILPYALTIIPEYIYRKVRNDLYPTSRMPAFLYSAPFLYAVIILAASVYFLTLYIRSTRNTLSSDTSSDIPNNSLPLFDRVFCKKLSTWQTTWFVWTLSFLPVTFICRFLDSSIRNNLLFSIIFGLSLLIHSYIFEKTYSGLSIVCACMLTIHYLATISRLFGEDPFTAWQMVLLFQLITVLFCILTANKKRKDPEGSSLAKIIFFWDALAAQIVTFLAVPILTESASSHLHNLAGAVTSVTHAHILDDIAKTIPYSIADSRLIVFALPGFLLLEIMYLVNSRNTQSRRRAIAFLLITLSCIVWMPILKLPSLSTVFEQAYLLPLTVFMALLPWLLPEQKHSSLSLLNLIYSCITMGLLAIIALVGNDLFSLISFGVISVIILLYGYFREKKPYLILGTVCTLGMLAYIANRVWGNMAWWIYLFVTGGVLITIAVRSEIRKRS